MTDPTDRLPPAADAQGPGEPESKPAFYCMECPLTFMTAESANVHHDATDHNQTWRPSQSFVARSVSPAGPPNDGQP